MSQGRPQPPLCYRLIRDASGQSETFGMLLLLAITVVGTTAVVAFGSQAMTNIEDSSNLQRTEHTMTLLDSRGAMVALGDSEQQSVRFGGSGNGKFTVEEGTGWISITHNNHTEAGDDEEIYNRSLGKLVYENDGTKIAYQGGGVWRVAENGNARMISKPEFHYRGATLTLPVIRILGNGSGVGDVRTTVSSTGDARRKYPNSSAEYSVSNKAYANPLKNGTVNVTVHSEYYQAWADYFRTRTTSDVTVYHSNQTVHMELLTLSDIGDFGTLNDDLAVGGYPEGHTLTNFSVTLESDTNNFKKMHWSFYADPGNQKFELHVTPDGDCSDIDGGTETVTVGIFYENASSDESQEWVNSVEKSDGDFIESLDCSGDGQMTVNFTAGNTDLIYGEINKTYDQGFSCGGGNKWHYADDYAFCDVGMGTASFGEHDADAAATHDPYVPASEVSPSHEENISFVLNHYFALMGPNFDLKGTDGPGSSDTINEDESSGTLTYDQEGGKFLTYLHVTENDVEVEVD